MRVAAHTVRTGQWLSLLSPAGALAAGRALGLVLPPPHRTPLVDPRLLAWLLEPQLVQKAEKELEEYGLAVG